MTKQLKPTIKKGIALIAYTITVASLPILLASRPIEQDQEIQNEQMEMNQSIHNESVIEEKEINDILLYETFEAVEMNEYETLVYKVDVHYLQDAFGELYYLDLDTSNALNYEDVYIFDTETSEITGITGYSATDETYREFLFFNNL